MTDTEADVEVGDDTPPLKEQAKARGWACDFFDFGKAQQPGLEFFNPGLVRRPDGLWLLVRRSELVPGMPYGRNGIWACKIGEDKKPMGGPLLKFRDSRSDEQFEDPRAVYWNGQTWVGCVNFTWFSNGSWTGAHQMIGIFRDQSPNGQIDEASWTPLARRDPIVGTNQGKAGHTQGKHNKNLTYFFHQDKLHCVYMCDPWTVVEFGTKWEDQIHHIAEGVKWNHGIIRGGTPPVLVGDLYYTFFHSSVPWRGRYRRYYMGAIAFEAKPPFRPILWTHEPLLIGSQNDPWGQKKPLVVFPCGAIMERGTWLVSYGINDLKSGWVEIPHISLEASLKSIPIPPGLSLLSSATEIPNYPPIPFEDLSGGVESRHAVDTESQLSICGPTPETGDGARITSKSSALPAQIPLKRKRGRPKKVLNPKA